MGNIEKMQSSPELNDEKLHDKFSGLFGRAILYEGLGPFNYEEKNKYHELKSYTKKANSIANGGKTILMNREIIIEDKIIDKKTGNMNINKYSLYMCYNKNSKGVFIEWKYNDGKMDKYLTSVKELDEAFININDALVKMEEERVKEKNRQDLKDLSYEISNTENQENESDYA